MKNLSAHIEALQQKRSGHVAPKELPFYVRHSDVEKRGKSQFQVLLCISSRVWFQLIFTVHQWQTGNSARRKHWGPHISNSTREPPHMKSAISRPGGLAILFSECGHEEYGAWQVVFETGLISDIMENIEDCGLKMYASQSVTGLALRTNPTEKSEKSKMLEYKT